MAIVKMSRFNLMAFAADRPQLLTALQSLADVHFADLTALSPGSASAGAEAETPADNRAPHWFELPGVTSDYQGEQLTAIRERVERYRACTKWLLDVQPKAKGLAAFNSALPEVEYGICEARAAALDLEPVCERLAEIKAGLDAARENIRTAKEHNQQLRRYEKLDVSFDQLRRVRCCDIAVGFLPKRWRQAFEAAAAEWALTYIEVLSVDEKSVYLLVMSEQSETPAVQEALRLNGFTRETFPSDQTPDRMMAANISRIEAAEAAVRAYEAELLELSDHYLDDFKLMVASETNAAVRCESQQCFLRTERTVVIEGYVPAELSERLRAAVEAACGQRFDLQIEVVERDDERVLDVPVKLANNALVRPFESIISTYSTPRYNELDPTPLMMPWYCLCFGMMMGDLGYGLVMLLFTTVALKCFKLKRSARSFVRFFQILSLPTIIAGACFGSFFSTSFPSLINPTEQYMEMLMISVIIGFVMLMTGLGIKAYMCIRDGDPIAAVYDVLFWYMILFGAVGMGLSMAGLVAAAVGGIGSAVMVLGIIGVWLFSARDEKKLFPRLAWGFYNVYGVSSWIGDLVSYTRIAALGLSGAFIGYAINLIAGNLMGSVVGYIGAWVILLLFHAFNLFLSGLSGYVHTMRLAYVEFFGKFFEGGGIAFRRFRAEPEYLDVR